jgi:hypothetical protein
MADNSEEGQGPQRAVAPMMMMMMMMMMKLFHELFTISRHLIPL